MISISTSRRRSRTVLGAILLAAVAATHDARAGFPGKIARETVVFRVADDGSPQAAGKLGAGDAIDIVGFRPDFAWIRIRYEDDEGYVNRDALTESELPTKEYFDPAAEKLGRRKNPAAYTLALLNARSHVKAKPAASAMLTYHLDSGLGLGAAALFRSVSNFSPGFDVGLEGILYPGTAGTPVALSLLYRCWFASRIKWGAEAMATMTSIQVTDGTQTTTESTTSVSLGALAGFRVDERFSVSPGLRLSIGSGSAVSIVVPGTWTF